MLNTSSLIRVSLGLALLFAISAMARAQETVALDFPLSGTTGATVPSGLAAAPTENLARPATLTIPFLRVNDDTSALVSVIFLDAPGLALRAKWVAAGSASVILQQNLSEGVQGWNQRVVVVPYELLNVPGTLILETDSAAMPVRRVVLHWAWPTSVYAGVAAQQVEFLQSPAQVLTKRDVALPASGTTPDTWSEGIWKAPLEDGIETLGQPLELDFPMTALPHVAVLRAKINGVPIGGALSFWVNGHQLDFAALAVPELATAGYFYGSDGKLYYAGWRDASVSIPAEDLRVGDNSIIVASPSGGSMKEAVLELSFDQEGAPFAAKTIPPSSVAPEPEAVVMRSGTATGQP